MPTPTLQDLLDQSAALHEHLCPRQVLGVRMGMHAAVVLGLELPQPDKRLLTIVETDGCFVDGIAVSTGCTLGHRTLRWVDDGKVAATFVDTQGGHAVRIHPSPRARELAPRYASNASSRWHAYLDGYQMMPAGELLVTAPVTLAVPVDMLVSSPDRRATCDSCGEEIFNGRESVLEGHVLCRRCADPVRSYLR